MYAIVQVHTDIQLKAMVVADLHLTGPRSAWFDRVSREFFMEFFFKVALRCIVIYVKSTSAYYCFLLYFITYNYF